MSSFSRDGKASVFVTAGRIRGYSELAVVERALAFHRGGIVATDNRAACSCCPKRGIPITGSIGILKAFCLDQTITAEDADAILTRMVDTGFHSPVRRITDLL